MRAQFGSVAAAVATVVLLVWPAAERAGARSVQTIVPSGSKGLKYHPYAAAIAPSGVLYVLQSPDRDADPSRIETYSPTGSPLRRWRVPAATPQGLAVDAAGNSYVTYSDTGEVLKFSPSGRLRARWSAPAVKTGANDYPGRIAVDAVGHVLVVIGGARIETFDSDGHFVATSPAAPGGILSVAVAGSGSVYIANRSGIAAIDPQTGGLRSIVRRERLLRVSTGWGVAAGPADSIYAIHARRIEKYSATGEYLGSVGGHRRANWLNAAVASDGSIFIPQFLLGLGSVVLKHAPITAVDERRPSIAVDSIASPPRRSPTATRVLARMRYTLSEPAQFRVTLKRQAQTKTGRRFIYVATVDIGVRAAGRHTLLLDWRAFGYNRRRFGERYQVTLIAQDDAGNESPPVSATFSVARR